MSEYEPEGVDYTVGYINSRPIYSKDVLVAEVTGTQARKINNLKELSQHYKRQLFEANAIKNSLYDKVDELRLEIDGLQDELGYVENYDDDLGDGMTWQAGDADIEDDFNYGGTD